MMQSAEGEYLSIPILDITEEVTFYSFTVDGVALEVLAIDIYYSDVDIIYIPEPEESEAMFQEHLRSLEETQNNTKRHNPCGVTPFQNPPFG